MPSARSLGCSEGNIYTNNTVNPLLKSSFSPLWEDENVEIMLEAAKASWLAEASSQYQGMSGIRVILDLQELKHKRQISALFVTKKGKVEANHFMTQYSCLNKEQDMPWKWHIKFYWKEEITEGIVRCWGKGIYPHYSVVCLHVWLFIAVSLLLKSDFC